MDMQTIAPAPFRGGLRINPGSALFLFICWWLLAWIFGAVVITRTGSSTVGLLRLSILLQDLIIFIMPVAMTLILAAKNPLEFIHIKKCPGTINSILVPLTIIVAIPAMNLLVKWNEGMHLPESLSAVEQILRTAEENAGATINMLLGEVGVSDMIISVLLIGILTGIAEELFFRGALQGILLALFRNRLRAIWTAAFVFSAIHMQFFGFFPRLIMGAFFGYLVCWSGSLWLSVIAHALNNSLVVLSIWLIRTGAISSDINTIGTGTSAASIMLVVASGLLTAIAVYTIRRVNNIHSL